MSSDICTFGDAFFCTDGSFKFQSSNSLRTFLRFTVTFIMLKIVTFQVELSKLHTDNVLFWGAKQDFSRHLCSSHLLVPGPKIIDYSEIVVCARIGAPTTWSWKKLSSYLLTDTWWGVLLNEPIQNCTVSLATSSSILLFPTVNSYVLTSQNMEFWQSLY